MLIDWTWGPEHVEIEAFADGRLEVLVAVNGCDREFETTIENDAHLGWLAFEVAAVGISRFEVPASAS